MVAQIIEAWQRVRRRGKSLAADEPDDRHAECNSHGARHAQGRLRCAGGGFQQPSSEARKERPQQAFDHENEADGNDKIAHGAGRQRPIAAAESVRWAPQRPRRAARARPVAASLPQARAWSQSAPWDARPPWHAAAGQLHR